LVDLNEVRSCLSLHRHLFEEAYLYGSVACGAEDEHSDVDLVLIRDTSLPFFDRIREVFDLVFALGRADLMIYTDRERRVEALRWLRQAENDLLYARLGLREGFSAQVCFLCQQIAEKALKSVHYGKLGKRIVYGHSLLAIPPVCGDFALTQCRAFLLIGAPTTAETANMRTFSGDSASRPLGTRWIRQQAPPMYFRRCSS
jgi:predicted nucleotidyltransferase